MADGHLGDFEEFAATSSSSLPNSTAPAYSQMETQSAGWTTKSSKRRKSADDNTTNQSTVTTANRFTPLSSLVEETEPRPPPIYVKNLPIGNYKHFINQVSVVARGDFECQATRKDAVTIFPRTPDAYRETVKYLKSVEVSFHSYQLPQEKAYRVVIRHLHPSTEPEEIRDALTQLSFKVRDVVNVLQSGTKTPLPLFFVDLEPGQDNTKIFDVKSLLYTRIRVEEPKRKRDIIQCKRCLRFGHTRTYCNHAVKCARCGESHSTQDCTRGPSEPRICSLCKGNHSSTYRGCLAYKELRSRRHNIGLLSKMNRRIEEPQTREILERPAGATSRTPLQSGHSRQVYTHTQHEHRPQHIMTGVSERDPRVDSPLYSQVLGGSHRLNKSNNFRASPGTQGTQRHNSPTYTSTNDSTENVSATLNSFIKQFQDIVTPLISTLTLLVNKLLSTHGRNT